MRIWTVSVNGRVVAAGRENTRGGIGIWLADELEDLLPVSVRKPRGSCSDWNEENRLRGKQLHIRALETK